MLLTVCVCAAVAVTIAPPPPLGLREALDRIVERGPDQAVARSIVPVAQAEVRTAGMLANPALVLSGGQSEPVFAAALQLKLPLLGQRGARVRAAERGADLALAAAQLALWRLRRDARVAYYAVARAEEMVAIAAEIELLTGRVAEMARKRFDAGAGTRLERDQAALIHVRSLQEVSDRRAAAQVARIELARLLGVAPAELGPLRDPLAQVGATPPMERLIDEARASHPELRALAAEEQAARARAQLARVERRPYPGLELTAELLDPSTCHPELTTNQGSRCVGPRAALSFELPVFNLNGGPIARAEAEARAAVFKTAAARLKVEAAVRAAHEQWTAAGVRAQFFEGQYVPAATAVEQMAREGFAAGRTGLLPLIEAERAVLEARLGRTDALYAVQAARADLEEASGVLLSTP